MPAILTPALVPAPVGPMGDGDPTADSFANDPRLAVVAQAVAGALVAALSPWLARFHAALSRLGDPAPVLLSADEARAYCGGVAKSTWCDFDQRGVIPAPVRVGGRVFWRRADLDAWVERSCPGRVRFDESQAAAKQQVARSGKHRQTT